MELHPNLTIILLSRNICSFGPFVLLGGGAVFEVFTCEDLSFSIVSFGPSPERSSVCFGWAPCLDAQL